MSLGMKIVGIVHKSYSYEQAVEIFEKVMEKLDGHDSSILEDLTIEQLDYYVQGRVN